jgi:hypothetical protein
LIPFGKPKSSQAGPPAGKRQVRLFIESLETRLAPANVFVVPVTQPSDVGHFFSLAEAVTAAGSSGVVTIEPGASPDSSSTPVQVAQDFITIQGDPNVPASILPSYQIDIRAGNVRLTNLSISALSVGTSTFLSAFNQVSKCLIQNITSFAPKTTFTQNIITGNVVISGFVTPTEVLGGQVLANNTFNSSTQGTLLFADTAPGTVIRNNTFNARGNAKVIDLRNCATADHVDTTVANNTITIAGTLGNGMIVRQEDTGFSLVRILNNTIDGSLIMSMNRGLLSFQALVEGNDFHDNPARDSGVGVAIFGDGTSSGFVDLGGGAFAGRGGNDFRSYMPPASMGNAAIDLLNATMGSVAAQHNIFNNFVSASNVIFASAGTIDVSFRLNNQQAFVQTLYNQLLGRTGSSAEIDGWVGLFNAQGQAAVVNGISKSPEALGRIVDQLYLRFLGRESDANGRAGWVNFLAGGGTLEQVETLFLTSPEYLSHINTEFVQSLYLNILGRPGSSAELALWDNNIQNLGLVGIANGFVHSPEHRLNTVRSFFQTFLHRTPPNTELAPLVNSTQTLLDLEGTVLSSDEFFTNG